MGRDYKKRHIDPMPYVVNPWGANGDNPFSTPWTPYSTPPRPDDRRRRIGITDAGSVSQYISPYLDAAQYQEFESSYHYLCTAMNACTSVRGKWDFESAQQIIPLYEAVLEFGAIIKDLKQAHPEQLQKWWRDDLSEYQQGAVRVLADIVQSSWRPEDLREFVKRREKGSRTRYFSYDRQNDVIGDCIKDRQGREFIFFSPFSINPALRQIQIDAGIAFDETTKKKWLKQRAVRYDFWAIILETANQFMHLNEENCFLPNHFPSLVENAGIIENALRDLKKMMKKNELNIGMASRIAVVQETIGEALDCWRSKKDRNKEFADLPKDGRSKIYDKRRRPYEAQPPKKGGNQPSFAAFLVNE